MAGELAAGLAVVVPALVVGVPDGASEGEVVDEAAVAAAHVVDDEIDFVLSKYSH